MHVLNSCGWASEVVLNWQTAGHLQADDSRHNSLADQLLDRSDHQQIVRPVVAVGVVFQIQCKRSPDETFQCQVVGVSVVVATGKVALPTCAGDAVRIGGEVVGGEVVDLVVDDQVVLLLLADVTLLPCASNRYPVIF